MKEVVFVRVPLAPREYNISRRAWSCHIFIRTAFTSSVALRSLHLLTVIPYSHESGVSQFFTILGKILPASVLIVSQTFHYRPIEPCKDQHTVFSGHVVTLLVHEVRPGILDSEDHSQDDQGHCHGQKYEPEKEHVWVTPREVQWIVAAAVSEMLDCSCSFAVQHRAFWAVVEVLGTLVCRCRLQLVCAINLSCHAGMLSVRLL